MNLKKKKKLAAKALKVGVERVAFNPSRIEEIKEAITKQDMKELKLSGAILIKDKRGRRTKTIRKTRRRAGSVRKKVNKSKQEYVKLTRKLRRHLREIRNQEKINEEKYKELMKKIRMRAFKSKRHLKENM
jgi:large subunit ribosomal protein L19e